MKSGYVLTRKRQCFKAEHCRFFFKSALICRIDKYCRVLLGLLGGGRIGLMYLEIAFVRLEEMCKCICYQVLRKDIGKVKMGRICQNFIDDKAKDAIFFPVFGFIILENH